MELSLKTSHWTVSVEATLQNLSLISSGKHTADLMWCVAAESPGNSDSALDSANCICSLDCQQIGMPACLTRNPCLDLVVSGSSAAINFSQLLQKSASMEHSKLLSSFGLTISPLSLVLSRYQPIFLMASPWEHLGNDMNCAH